MHNAEHIDKLAQQAQPKDGVVGVVSKLACREDSCQGCPVQLEVGQWGMRIRTADKPEPHGARKVARQGK